MPMVLYSSFVLIFAATAFTSESIEQYVLAVPMSNSDGNNPQFLKKLAVTYNSDPTTGEKTMPQVQMSEDPVNNMQIATKKYVDNSLWYGADMEMSDTSTHPVRNMVIKKYVDDSTSNTLRYTAQTLTNEQKKQARDNIEAADAAVVGNRLDALSEEIASIDGLASKSYVDTKVAGLVNSAPETLDTLNELAAALGNDANFSTTIATQLGNKVDKVDGKGLSTNDYTTDEKTKLLGINAGAQVNVLESVKVNGAVLTATDKTVDISVPTKTSNLINDSGYITSIPSEYITESELNAKGYLTNYTETDPTVPAWAKAATKPTYTAAEVGALPADTVIPVVPDSLKNPYAITFTGGATGSYDGSSELSIAIPEAKTYKAGNGISISDDGTISVTTATYYTGTADPVNTLGADGDLYLKTEG